MEDAEPNFKKKVRKVRAFTLEDGIMEEITAIAKAENRSVSRMVEVALQEWIKAYRERKALNDEVREVVDEVKGLLPLLRDVNA